MKKYERISEQRLNRIIDTTVNNIMVNEGFKDDMKDVAKWGIGLGLAGTAALTTPNPFSDRIEAQIKHNQELRRSFPEDREEFGDDLRPQRDTITWEKAKGMRESLISRVVSEAQLRRIVNESIQDILNKRW